MNFRNCDYYEKSMEQNHCPFDKICHYDCYFVHKIKAQDYDELLRDYRNLEDMYYDSNYNEDDE